MENYQVTIGYKSVVVLNVKAENEDDAKEIATEQFAIEKDKMFKNNKVELQDDSYKAEGVLNMDNTWNML